MTTKRVLAALPIVLVGWIAVMALVMRFSSAAPAAVVLLPAQSLLANLPQETAILGLSGWALTVRNSAGVTEDLYAAGAWLVLPAGLTGCLPLTKAQKAQLS